MPFKPDQPGVETLWSDATTATILLGKDHGLYYYFGFGYDEHGKPDIRKTNFSGIRSVIIDKKKKVQDLVSAGVISSNREAGFVIKATEQSTYDDFVRILDEMNIHNITMKAVVDLTDEDRKLMKAL